MVIVAHPDDEILGCGGTIAKHISEGDAVNILIMSDGVTSRKNHENEIKIEILRRKQSALRATQLLKCNEPSFFNFPDNSFDSVPMLNVVQSIESILLKVKPDIVYTHFAGDLNIDHAITNRAVITACRPQPGSYVKRIFSFEVMSSTDWHQKSIINPFSPNYFVDITDYLMLKIEALRAYEQEMRDYPHSRSYAAIRALAEYRGASVGISAAEGLYVERIIA